MVDIFSVSSLLICGPTVLRNLMMSFLIFQLFICRDGNHNTLTTIPELDGSRLEESNEGSSTSEDLRSTKDARVMTTTSALFGEQ